MEYAVVGLLVILGMIGVRWDKLTVGCNWAGGLMQWISIFAAGYIGVRLWAIL